MEAITRGKKREIRNRVKLRETFTGWRTCAARADW